MNKAMLRASNLVHDTLRDCCGDLQEDKAYPYVFKAHEYIGFVCPVIGY